MKCAQSDRGPADILTPSASRTVPMPLWWKITLTTNGNRMTWRRRIRLAAGFSTAARMAATFPGLSDKAMSAAFELPALHSFTAIPLEVTFSTFGNRPAQGHSSPCLAYDAPASALGDTRRVTISLWQSHYARRGSPGNAPEPRGTDDLSDFSYSLSARLSLMPAAGLHS